MAYVYSKLSRKQQAKKYYELALKYHPHDIELLIEFAVYLETVEIKESLKVYAKIIKLAESDPEIQVKPELYNNYAVTLIRNKKLDEAEKYLIKAEETNTENDLVLKYFTLFNRGIYYEEKFQFAEAEKKYLELTSLNTLLPGKFLLNQSLYFV